MTETKTTSFAEALIALGQHMQAHPDLPPLSSVTWDTWKQGDDYVNGLNILLRGFAEAMPAWAAQLSLVDSWTDQHHGKVFAHMTGLLGDLDVKVWTTFEDGPVSPEDGKREWDVFAEGGVS